MKKFILTSISIFFTISFLTAQHNAEQILNKSIKYHDPNDRWNAFNGELKLKVIRPSKEESTRRVLINNKKQKFIFQGHYEEGVLSYKVLKDKAQFLWDGNSEIHKSLIKKYKISKDRAHMYKNYFTYLYGMPMKLRDPGTNIESKAEEVEFHGEEYYKVKVTYDPKVGDDIWYFYFDKNTYALEAYQFFHDESKNDGEYILFEDTMLIDGIKIPKTRKWYYNKDDGFLATDQLY